MEYRSLPYAIPHTVTIELHGTGPPDVSRLQDRLLSVHREADILFPTPHYSLGPADVRRNLTILSDFPPSDSDDFVQ